MRKPAVLLITFLLLCVANGVALAFLFSSSTATPPAAPRTKPAPRTRHAPSITKSARDVFVLAIPEKSEKMGSGRSRGQDALG